ncbi:MAG: 23S rRNA (uracil(1939)-C(5))-methyltransferase RlmD [Bacteroidia bacterium]|jgi:23S rRNA (uracil1939-C5)-methyltransferase|nr:23S rRNA (uracil(1939)-C(5))-methyltransferase RlmD [Bacteroidia bacterium]
MRKPKKEIPLHALEVTDISSEGKAVARHEGLVVFIEGAVPGDVADVIVYRKKSSFAEARLETLINASKHRVDPVCKHFGTCGGCKWQHFNYNKQLEFKQKYVIDAFTRIGKLDFPELLPIKGNAKGYEYRNKLEFTFSNKRWLKKEEMDDESLNKNGCGFHIPGMFDKVLDIEHCHLQPEPSNAIRNAVKTYALKNGLSFFDIRTQSGFLRTLMLRNSSKGEWMLILTVFEWLEKELFDLLAFLKTEFPQITSLQYAHNPKGNDTLAGLDIKVYHGRDHIVEEMEGLKFKISPRSFYQTNSTQAYELYKITRDFAGIQAHEVVYDLYTGTGTIANFVAAQAKKVIGIEYVEDAVADAHVNSDLNGIKNTRFFAGDMKKVLNEAFIREHGAPDVVICDPPRAGMEEAVVKALLFANPQRIVYVSCNPATQARDLALLKEHYSISKTQPVDMFPQTAHVENVCLLLRNK